MAQQMAGDNSGQLPPISMAGWPILLRLSATTLSGWPGLLRIPAKLVARYANVLRLPAVSIVGRRSLWTARVLRYGIQGLETDAHDQGNSCLACQRAVVFSAITQFWMGKSRFSSRVAEASLTSTVSPSTRATMAWISS